MAEPDKVWVGDITCIATDEGWLYLADRSVQPPGGSWRHKCDPLEDEIRWAHYCRSLVKNVMYRLKTLTGDRLWPRDVDVQDAKVSVRVGIINRMPVVACPNSFRVA